MTRTACNAMHVYLLPANDPEEPLFRPDGEAENRKRPQSTQGTILVVDDEGEIRETLADILRYEGLDVATAPSGRAAMQYLQNHPLPCLILLDLMMPGMNGWELRVALERDPQLSAIPVVVISGSSDVSEQAQLLKASDFLRKPIEVSLLLSIVRRFCP